MDMDKAIKMIVKGLGLSIAQVAIGGGGFRSEEIVRMTLMNAVILFVLDMLVPEFVGAFAGASLLRK